MENVLFRRHSFDLQRKREHFGNVFTLISEKAGDKAFTRFNEEGEPTRRLAPAYYEATVCAFSENEAAIKAMDAARVMENLQKAFSSDDFLQSTGPGANTIPKLHARIDAVSRTFYNP